jgi:hypothetical protein
MLKLIELMLIAAAVDGKIDKVEQDAIIRSIEQNNHLTPITHSQLVGIQEQLINRFRSGETRQDLIKAAGNTMEAEAKLIAYANSVEIVLANKEFTASEAEYLKEQRTLMDLDPLKVEKIHFSAQLRYGRLISL